MSKATCPSCGAPCEQIAVFGTKVHACPCVPADGWYAFGVMQPAPATSPRDRLAEITAASVRTTADPEARLLDVEEMIRAMNREFVAVDKYTLMERDMLRQRIAREQTVSTLHYTVSADFGEPDCIGIVGYQAIGGKLSVVNYRPAAGDAERDSTTAPADPLDAAIDGVALRTLLRIDAAARRDSALSRGAHAMMTPAQRAAVSAHWSAELRRKVEAGKRADAERATSVVLDCAEDL